MARDPKPLSVFVARLGEAKRPKYNSAYKLAADAEELSRLARTLDRISERACNVNLDDANQAKEDNRRMRARKRILEIAEKYGFDAVHFQTDPRGLPVYLGYKPYMTENNYNTHGIAVPL